MMAGDVEAPGVFLDASAVLERQYTAFCLDQWVKKYAERAFIPLKLKDVLSTISKQKVNVNLFPYSFLTEVEAHRVELIEQFLALFNSGLGVGLSKFSVEWLKCFAEGDFNTQASAARPLYAGVGMKPCPKQSECKCYDGPETKYPCSLEYFEKACHKCWVKK